MSLLLLLLLLLLLPLLLLLLLLLLLVLVLVLVLLVLVLVLLVLVLLPLLLFPSTVLELEVEPELPPKVKLSMGFPAALHSETNAKYAASVSCRPELGRSSNTYCLGSTGRWRWQPPNRPR